MFSQTVREFIKDSYQIVNPGNPATTLPNSDQIQGLYILNRLISSYSGTGLMLTIAQEVDFTMAIGQMNVTFADPLYTPAADVQVGRLANLENAWLLLDGVTYPLVDESRNVFLDAYKYDPQLGLPRFCIIYNQTNITTMRVYPAPSQVYQLSVYGKFEMPSLTLNQTMSSWPNYYLRFFQFALAKDLSVYKGRSSSWTPALEQMLKDATEDMQACSAVNLAISAEHDSYLNGSWRVRAGI